MPEKMTMQRRNVFSILALRANDIILIRSGPKITLPQLKSIARYLRSDWSDF